MPQIDSREFGPLTFDPSEVYHFTEGLHGFEQDKEFLLVQRPAVAPFCFLQSVADSGLRFVCLPAAIVDNAYQAGIGADDAADLEIEPGSYGPASPAIQILTILTIPETGPVTANLLGPVVLALESRRGRQCIQFGTDQPPAHEIPWMTPRGAQAVS